MCKILFFFSLLSFSVVSYCKCRTLPANDISLFMQAGWSEKKTEGEEDSVDFRETGKYNFHNQYLFNTPLARRAGETLAGAKRRFINVRFTTLCSPHRSHIKATLVGETYERKVVSSREFRARNPPPRRKRSAVSIIARHKLKALRSRKCNFQHSNRYLCDTVELHAYLNIRYSNDTIFFIFVSAWRMHNI